MNTEQTVNNTQMAILFNVNRMNGVVDGIIDRRLMNFKAAAAYAVKVVQDPDNYKKFSDGRIYWTDRLEIIGSHHQTVAYMTFNGKLYYDEVIMGSDEYPAVQYIFAALKRAIAEL